ncbi:hypothetical protein DPEC_G00304340 [Dallia pectoralis]|uniref:Uncharacterized protein n=1 Tax=Dallia pectoralis TaxID=75939 RepID=A0ACC2FDM0_DALPE|nr:hypothetical protein DPEC_G00304340 [Dallia pectoralis]
MRKASRYHTLSSMANSGCLLLSGSGMLPHSLHCPQAFLYLTEGNGSLPSYPSVRSGPPSNHPRPGPRRGTGMWAARCH